MVSSITSEVTKEGNNTKVSIKTNGIPYASLIEYGTVNIIVGTPEVPRTEWKAYAERGFNPTGQNMPFCRTSDFFTFETRKQAFKEAFK
jgi:hypothetical protein